jgi:predicted permease
MSQPLLRRWRPLLQRDRVERELDAELRFHLEMEIEQQVRRGASEGDARRSVLRAFGGVEQIKEQCRDSWSGRMLEILAQDVRYALRGLRRSPGFALLVVLTLGLGIGANTAVFSVLNGVLLRPLPFAGGDRLVRVRQAAPGAGLGAVDFSVPELADLRRESRTVAAFAEYHHMWFNLIAPRPERVRVAVVSAPFFEMLGVKPLHGRTFVAADEGHDAAAVLVLSHAYWRRSFAADPAVVGRVVEMNDRPHTIVGVLPKVPGYPDENDAYVTASACPFRSSPATVGSRARRGYAALARLADGVTPSDAGRELSAIHRRMVEAHPESYPRDWDLQLSVVPLDEELTRNFRPTLVLLLWTVGLVLVIACANVANLTLSRHLRRERELAVRSALGAAKGRLARQLMTESLVLAVAGGLVGVLVAVFSMDALVAFARPYTPRADDITIDVTVLAFAFGISILSGVAFGAVPVLSRRLGLTAFARTETGPHAGAGAERVRSTLVVAQVAMAMAVLVCAGLMLRTVAQLQRVDPGIRTAGVASYWLWLDWKRYDSAGAIADFYTRVLDRTAALPGVRSAALAGSFPLNPQEPATASILVEGGRRAALRWADMRTVSAAYFRTMGVPILAGRAFRDAADERDQVAIVSETMARHYWGDEPAVGRRFSQDGGSTWLEVVGVAGDVRQWLSSAVTVEFYRPYHQLPMLAASLLVRSDRDVADLQADVERAVAAIDPRQPVSDPQALPALRDEGLFPWRLLASLLTMFAALALAIAGTGIGGVLAYSVGQRRHEFGVRMALGASHSRVLRMVMRQGLWLIALGLGLGVGASLAITRLMSRVLFEVEPSDPATFAAVAAVLAAVAAIASYLPARHATTIDPLSALRLDG